MWCGWWRVEKESDDDKHDNVTQVNKVLEEEMYFLILINCVNIVVRMGLSTTSKQMLHPIYAAYI